MKRTTKFMLILVLLATAAPSLPAPSHAGDLAGATPMQATVAGDPTEDRWWGGVAAAGCGFAIRGWPALGWNLGYNALLVVFCLTALLDAAVP